MPSRPDLTLLIRNKGEGGGYSKAGVAWKRTTRGNRQAISIKLDPGIVLDWRMCADFHLELYEDNSGSGGPDDDIPF